MDKNDFQSGFNKPVTDFNLKEIWTLVKFAKHVRLRCRNNAAFNNFMKTIFTDCTFRQVAKQKECYSCKSKLSPDKYCKYCNGTGIVKYEGLEITKKGETLSESEE